MKNYFNYNERFAHIIACALESYCERLAESQAITEEERKLLKQAYKCFDKFNNSIFSEERFGEAYRRKIISTMDCNELKLMGKYAPCRDAVSHCPAEDIKPTIKELQFGHCMDCTRKDHTKCSVYSLSVACDLDSNNNENTACPFSIKIGLDDLDDNDIEDFS